MAKAKVTDEKVIELNVAELVEKIRACCFATASVVNHERVSDQKAEERCYRDLFKLVTGRKPTPAELEQMTGGSPK